MYDDNRTHIVTVATCGIANPASELQTIASPPPSAPPPLSSSLGDLELGLIIGGTALAAMMLLLLALVLVGGGSKREPPPPPLEQAPIFYAPS